jgi:hypothetical protein
MTPAVETFIPVEERENVPDELPIVTLFVPVPKETLPFPLTVNAPDPWVYPVIPDIAPAAVMSQEEVSIATEELLLPILV